MASYLYGRVICDRRGWPGQQSDAGAARDCFDCQGRKSGDGQNRGLRAETQGPGGSRFPTEAAHSWRRCKHASAWKGWSVVNFALKHPILSDVESCRLNCVCDSHLAHCDIQPCPRPARDQLLHRFGADLHLKLDQRHIGRVRVPRHLQIAIDLLCDYYTRNILAACEVLLHPSHIARELPEHLIGTAAFLQFDDAGIFSSSSSSCFSNSRGPEPFVRYTSVI